MLTIHPELAPALAAVERILNAANVAFVKDEEKELTCRWFQVTEGETVRLGLIGLDPGSEEPEFHVLWEAHMLRGISEGVDPDNSDSWVRLKSAKEFALWLLKGDAKA